MNRRNLRLYWLLLAGTLVACVTNHATLEKKPDTGHGASNAGGASGVAGGHGPLAGSAGQTAGSGGHADDEPPGTSVLTIVNGVVDAPRVALCFARVDADAESSVFGDPLSLAPLGYAQSLVLHEVPGADLAQDTLQPFVIAGELELIAGLSCPAAVERARLEELPTLAAATEPALGGVGGDGAGGAGGAGGESASGAAGEAAAGAAGAGGVAPVAVRSRLRVRGLPAIAAGTLNSGRSLLLVANGCMAGATYDGPNAELYCGAGYSERTPTLSAVLVSLSRQTAFDRVGMQVVHASLATGPIDVRSHAPFPVQDPGLSLAGRVVAGQVAPRPASVSNNVFDYGSARQYSLDVSASSGVLFSEGWLAVLARGGLTELSNSSTYALVLSGPRGDRKGVPELWNPPVLTAIAASPE